MHYDFGTLTWILGALFGVALNAIMIREAILDRRVAISDSEKNIVRTDLVQWSAGLVIKVIGLSIGIWAAMLPDRGAVPQGTYESFAAEYGRAILIIGLNVIMVGMDMRDVLLIVLKRRGRRLIHEEYPAGEAALIAEIDRLKLELEGLRGATA